MIASVPDVDLAEYQRAVRLLLVHGLVTIDHPGKDALEVVRRFAPELARDLFAAGGYALDVRPHAVRLRRPVDAVDAVHGARARIPFDRLRYALLALVLAVLEQAPEVISLSDLAREVRTHAMAIDGFGFDPERHVSRRAFAQVVEWLEERGVVALTDGSRDAWERLDADGEALYDVDRDAARLLFVPTREGTGRDDRRQAVMRRLLDEPVVYYADLPGEVASYARREARSIAADLERLTGAQVERRVEGLALVVIEGRFSDEPFPRGGSDAQVALLLVDRIAAALRGARLPVVAWPQRTSYAELLVSALPDGVEWSFGRAQEPDPCAASVPLISDDWLDDAATALVRDHADHLRAAHADARTLRSDAVSVLVHHDLLRAVPGGFAVMPALARYRDVKIRAPSAASVASLAGALA